MSSGMGLVTSGAAICCGGTGRSLRSYQPSLIAMVGGVSPSTMLRDKAIMWPSSVVLLLYDKGSFLMPQRTLMWQFVSSTVMRRAGLYFRDKDANLLIFYALVEMPYSWRSKIAGYAAKEFVCCCLPHVLENVEAIFCGRRGWEGFDRASLVCPRV